MSGFLSKLATEIIHNEGFKQASAALFDSYVLGLTGQSKKIERTDIKKLISTAQVFYKSDDKKVKNEGAILLSMILDICSTDYPDIVPIANSIFAYSGDFPNIQLLLKRNPKLIFRYSFYSEAQIEFRQTLNTVKELNFTLTDFQRSLWQNLYSDKDVITSAPTSAGKTHIILNYLLDKLVKSDGSFAAVIVPTRALISEVSGKIYELANQLGYVNEIEICTVPSEGDFGSKTFFVMTQERLHEILLRGDISFDYLFIDEAHNITDKSRGVLLHLTIEKMLDDSNPQIIISMPSSSYQDSFSTIFKGIEFTKEITQHSPVAKVIMTVIPSGRDLIISRHNTDNVKRIEKGFKKKHLADIVLRLGNGQSNIIYRNKTDHCENIADAISERITEVVENALLDEAADFVEKFVHNEFSLAQNLRKGVAFHYGPLPSSIRVMIENLMKSDQIKFIACTSTLAEGVNLPAKNLFLKNPSSPILRKPSERIEDVKIANITGRAGRMLQHFSGNIFLVEPEIWTFKDYFEDETESEDKIPTYFRALNDELNMVISALEGGYAHSEQDQYRLYTIANKLIREFASNTLNKTLEADELALSIEQREFLRSHVKLAHDKLKVSAFTLEANPTVGYIQQNKLFDFLNQQIQLSEWVLPHPKAPESYNKLLKISTKLNEFGVYIPSEEYTLEYVNVITKKWIQGNSLKDIIVEQIAWDLKTAADQNKTAPSINSSVRSVIKVINNDIRFRYSNALKCYQVLLNNVLISRGIDLPNIKLHTFIEIGAIDERMITLINIGLSREAAKEIHDNLPSTELINTSKDLLDLQKRGKLKNIHSIISKEIEDLFS